MQLFSFFFCIAFHFHCIAFKEVIIDLLAGAMSKGVNFGSLKILFERQDYATGAQTPG